MSEDNVVKKGEAKNARLGDLALRIENQTEIDKDEWWNQTRRWVQQKYEEHGVSFNPDTIQTKEELDQHLMILKNMEGKAQAEREASTYPAPRGGTTAPLSQSQITGQTKVQVEKESDVPLSWLEFDTEEEMIATLKKISEDTTDPRSTNARNALNELTKKMTGKNQEFELEGAVSDLVRKNKKLSMRKVQGSE